MWISKLCGSAEPGASVLAVDRDYEAVADTTRHLGTRCVSAYADVTAFAGHKELVQHAMREFGRLDILVNNAAIQFTEPFLQATVASWDHVGRQLERAFFTRSAAE